MPVPQPSVQSGRYISTNCRRSVFTSLYLLIVIGSETGDISDKALQVVSKLLYQTAISPLSFIYFFRSSKQPSPPHPTNRPRNQFQSRNGPFLPRDRLWHSRPRGFDACREWRKTSRGSTRERSCNTLRCNWLSALEAASLPSCHKNTTQVIKVFFLKKMSSQMEGTATHPT